MPVSKELSVAEIGCGEGGNLKPFLDLGCRTVGIDLAPNKIDNAHQFFKDHPYKNNLTLISTDIYDVWPEEFEQFDLIIMRDTLEHIPNQDELLRHVKQFLKPSGMLFVSFPSWRMPFGGHQQICSSRILRKLPYFHLLPKNIYATMLHLFGESTPKIRGLLEIRDTRMYYQRFLKFIKKQEYQIRRIDYFLINPSYEVKFKVKTCRLCKLLSIPYLRDYISTTCYCLISAS
jgi:SAM-dependent methyltransferase